MRWSGPGESPVFFAVFSRWANLALNYKNSKILNNTEEGIYDGLKKAIENKLQESETEVYDNENIIEELKSIL